MDPLPRTPTPAGRRHLRPAAIAWRIGHTLIAAGFLAAIAYVWWCALTRRRGRLLGFAVGALVTEGAVVAANGGDCPLGPLQDRLGDPVPCFELVLPPRAAKLAVPVLGGIAAAGIALAAARPPLSPAAATPAAAPRARRPS